MMHDTIQHVDQKHQCGLSSGGTGVLRSWKVTYRQTCEVCLLQGRYSGNLEAGFGDKLNVRELQLRLYLFHFFYDGDLDCILDDGPCTYDQSEQNYRLVMIQRNFLSNTLLFLFKFMVFLWVIDHKLCYRPLETSLGILLNPTRSTFMVPFNSCVLPYKGHY